MTAKDIEKLEKQIDELPAKLTAQLQHTMAATVANLELRIHQALSERIVRVESSTASAHHRIDAQSETIKNLGIEVNLVEKDVAVLQARPARHISAAPVAAVKQPKEIVLKIGVPVASLVGLVSGLLALLH